MIQKLKFKYALNQVIRNRHAIITEQMLRTPTPITGVYQQPMTFFNLKPVKKQQKINLNLVSKFATTCLKKNLTKKQHGCGKKSVLKEMLNTTTVFGW